jgi:D-alanyl-D-alanine carboxypeptidase
MEKNTGKRKIRRILYALVVTWTVLGMVGLLSILQWMTHGTEEKITQVYGDKMETEVTEESNTTENGTEITLSPGEKLDETETGICRQIYENNPELLVLVNKEHELDEDYDSQLRSICNGRLEASGRLYEDLCAMLQAAGTEGYDYWIASAYRSRERQQELVDEDVSALMQKGFSYEEALGETLRETMPAGCSEHETGLALDLLCSGNTAMDVSQADEPGNRWLAQHCQEYGFILRYPEDKVSVTEIDYEPWHFRYVGKEAAQYITEHGLTLEEFVELATNE